MTRWARRIASAALVIVATGAIALACARVAERGRWALGYSTHGAGPEGTRGLFLFARRRGAEVIRWSEDLGALPAGGMLVALGGCDHHAGRPLTRPERERLVRWVEEGGTLVVAGATDYLPRELGVSLYGPSGVACSGTGGVVAMVARAWARAGGEDPDGADVEASRAAEVAARADEPPPLVAVRAVGEPLRGMAHIALRRAARIDVEDLEGATVILRGDDGIAGVALPRGGGRVIALASASVLQNRDLASEGGAALFARLLRAHGGPVYFDEHHLGGGAPRSFMRWVAEVGLMPLALQVLVVVLFFLWRAGARFGATRAEDAPAPERGASFVGAMGALLARSEDAEGALALVARHALERIATFHRLDGIAHPQLPEELARRGRHEAADAARRVLAWSSEAVGGRALARRVAQIDAEVARATERLS